MESWPTAEMRATCGTALAVAHLVAVYRRFVMLREYPKHGTAHLFTA